MGMDITGVVAAVCMSADKCLMPRKICFGIFHANSLCLLPGQTMIGNIHGIVADNVMVAFDFIISLIFMVLLVEQFTLKIECFRIETGRYLERIFPFMGVRFIAINDHYDSAEENDDKGRILIPFNNLINDTYCRDISMRVRSHLDVKRKEGQFIGSFAGYGYQKDPKDKNHLIIDEYAAGIVQEIFKLKLNGMSAQHIANHLNELGVLPPNEYKRASGFNYTCGFRAGLNQKWTVVSVNRILKNESYTGTLIQGKRRKINYKIKKSQDVGTENWIRVEGTHDAIISRGEFQQVQQLMELDTRTSPSQKTVYPLSGFLRCADCGQNMIRRTVTKKGKKYQYYHCSTYKNGGDCTPHMINGEKLEGSVLAAIRHLKKQAEMIRAEQIKLYESYADGILTRNEYLEKKKGLGEKLADLQEKIRIEEEEQETADELDEEIRSLTKQASQKTYIGGLTKECVDAFVSMVYLYDDQTMKVEFNCEDVIRRALEKYGA